MKTILVIGTYDTKSDELDYLSTRIKHQGGQVLSMDVSVLGDPSAVTDISKHEVAEAAGSSIQAVIDSGGENTAMQIMAAGASKLIGALYRDGRFDAMLALGGTMGTDLALDCAQTLPLGVPKYIVSTVSFSPLIPAERLAADVQMILWAGGLYGLNSVCKSSLSQAAGAVLGAAHAVEPFNQERPLVGMTSLGSSCLTYMKTLKPALEERGFELAIFHATGMGGMTFENLCRDGAFVCVMDFALPELGNLMFGSVINGGRDRMLNAGSAGIPQIVAPGCLDMIDFAVWQDIPEQYSDRPFYVHNRLIAACAMNIEDRRNTAQEIQNRLLKSTAPTHVILPNRGMKERDREGGPAHDPAGLAAFLDEMRKVIVDPVQITEIDAHINDAEFCKTTLSIFDNWLADGTIRLGKEQIK